MSAVDDATHLLEVEGLSAWYERDRPVLTDVSFALEAGEAVGLIGLNGAGKTTMLSTTMNSRKIRRFRPDNTAASPLCRLTSRAPTARASHHCRCG